MTVVHPKEGAVYWEGPVVVELGVTLSGKRKVLYARQIWLSVVWPAMRQTGVDRAVTKV